MTVNPIVVFCVYTYITIANLTSFICLLYIAYAIHRLQKTKQLQVSLILKLYLTIIWLTNLFLFLHAFFVLINWKNDFKFPLGLYFWTGTLDGTLLVPVSIFVFFVTFERCLIITFKFKHQKAWSKLIVYLALISAVINGSIQFITFMLFRSYKIPDDCPAFGCTIQPFGQNIYTYSKATVVIGNLMVGIWYLIAAYRLKQLRTINKTTIKLDLVSFHQMQQSMT